MDETHFFMVARIVELGIGTVNGFNCQKTVLTRSRSNCLVNAVPSMWIPTQNLTGHLSGFATYQDLACKRSRQPAWQMDPLWAQTESERIRSSY